MAIYKYLSDLLEDSAGAEVESLTLIAAEVLRDHPSDAFEDFMREDAEDICKALGWIKDASEEVENECEDEALAGMMVRNHRDGLLAEVNFPVHHDFRFREDGSWSSCMSSSGYCEVEWVYADTIGELGYKIHAIAEAKMKDWIEEERKAKEPSLTVAEPAPEAK